MKRLLLIPIILVVFTACRKDSPEFPEDQLLSVYQPLTKSSSWTYRYTDNSGEEFDFTNELTGNTENFNNKEFYEASIRYGSNESDEKAYYSSEGGVYNLIADNMVLWGDACEYLHASASVNSTWNKEFIDTSSGIAIPARMAGTVVEKDLTLNIGGKIFKNVVQTKVEVQYGAAGTYQTINYAEYFVAPNIGIVRIRTVTPMLSFSSVIDLIDYSVL